MSLLKAGVRERRDKRKHTAKKEGGEKEGREKR